ncbi:MAG: hypothetical protein HY236_09440 [Acidobacteria bacterium]|nr:hypothetical protein [Acidobacteriota bacterium]
MVGVAAQVGIKGGKISAAKVGITGTASKSYRAAGVEAALVGRPASGATLAEAAQKAADGVDPLSDLYAAADYRAHVTRVSTRRALEAALARAR